MPETSPTTQDAAGVTRTPTGTIVDQSPTSTQPSTPQPDKLAEALTASPESSSTTTTQPSETPKTETKPDGKEAPKSLINEKSEEPKGAPEKYEDFKVPEGYVLDEATGKDASALFKKLNLNQSGAQELVDFYIAKTREAQQRPYDTYANMRQQWRDRVNADSEIGGSRLRGTIASIGKLIDSFGSSDVRDAFREAMEFTGAGDHPAVIRGLFELSKHLTEGGAVRGNGPPIGRDASREQQTGVVNGQPTAAQAMYPHLTSTNR